MGGEDAKRWILDSSLSDYNGGSSEQILFWSTDSSWWTGVTMLTKRANLSITVSDLYARPQVD